MQLFENTELSGPLNVAQRGNIAWEVESAFGRHQMKADDYQDDSTLAGIKSQWKRARTLHPSRLGARTGISLGREIMVGILVVGNNHFILSGPEPEEAQALELARYWSIVQIGEKKSAAMGEWEIRTKQFRENLEWAVVVPGDREISPGVEELLGELVRRGIVVQRCSKGCF